MDATRMLALTAALVLGGLAASPAHAGKSVEERRFDLFSSLGSFQTYHPDVRYREQAMKLYREGRYEEALRRFEHAARYADKPSQAMLAEMYWQGRGAPADRVLAYAWMDLSAERDYPDFVRFRERYWEQLDADERAQARIRGQAMLDEYGDAVARPRLEAWLRRGLTSATGSRTGYVSGALQVTAYSTSGEAYSFHGHEYYADSYWKPREYWRLQDEIWRAPVRERVDVGAPETVRGTGPEPATDAGDAKP
ncbi:MAG: hypothetical protein LCH59_03675 [Proteobacteria bacterium]|nr:hypothetical protein [Pseudomonadota bacterium]